MDTLEVERDRDKHCLHVVEMSCMQVGVTGLGHSSHLRKQPCYRHQSIWGLHPVWDKGMMKSTGHDDEDDDNDNDEGDHENNGSNGDDADDDKTMWHPVAIVVIRTDTLHARPVTVCACSRGGNS